MLDYKLFFSGEGVGVIKEMRTVATPSPPLDLPVGLDSPENLISLQKLT